MGNACIKEVDTATVAEYKLEIKTSHAYRQAGTSALTTVNVDLVGEKGNSTGWQELDNSFWVDFERGSRCFFTLTMKDVGLPIIVRLKLVNSHSDDEWLCEDIVVTLGESKVHFPVYDWVEGRVVQVTSGAVLPQHVTSKYVRSMRKQEIEQSKARYGWVPRPAHDDIGWGTPRYMDASTVEELPLRLRRDAARQKDKEQSELGSVMDFVRGKLSTIFDPLKTTEDYKKLEEIYGTVTQHGSEFLSDWDTDEGMGRQMLNGINPLTIKKCFSIPAGFNVTNELVSESLRDGKTLEEEMQNGRVYIADYVEYLDGVSRTEGNVCCDSRGLFYVNCKDDFVPIAIQLVPDDCDYLFTPKDRPEDWLLAKMHFRVAYGNIHEWIYHYLLTHAITEPFTIALFRCLPRAHPIYKLLRPHLWTVAAINTDARVTLIAPGAPPSQALAVSALELVQKAFKHFHMDNLNIPKVLEKKGLDNPEQLPKFYFRDDTTKLYKLMGTYVNNFVNFFYKSDKDVQQDFELQDFAKDVAKEGIGWMDGDTKGMPEKITSIDKLVEICTMVMYTCSAQHAAVNFGQFEMYKFVPNSPGAMNRPPHKKGEANEDVIMQSLPKVDRSLLFITVAYTLSRLTENEVYIGQFPKKYFEDEGVMKIQEEYSQNLQKFELEIKERNKGIPHPYTYLLPSDVPNYIAI